MRIAALLVLPCLAIAAAAATPSGEARGRITYVDDARLELWIRGRHRVPMARGEATAVTGHRESWHELEPGDRVRITWEDGAGHTRVARRVEVLERAEEVAPPPARASGWIRGVEGDVVVVRSLLGRTGRFERLDRTRVDGKREHWDALEPGDRVEVEFQPGRHPPGAIRISVLVRVGEKPDPIRLRPDRDPDREHTPTAGSESDSEIRLPHAPARSTPAPGDGD